MSNERDTDSRYSITPAMLERLVGSERDFREAVLVRLAEMGVKLEGVQNAIEFHVKQDEERFSKVTLTMGENTGTLKYLLGGAAIGGFLIMAVIGVARLFT